MASVTAVILEPKKIKSVTASTLSPSVCHEMRGWDARIECCYICIFSNFFYWRIIALQNFLFSVKSQHESAIGIHTSPPFWTSLPSPSPSHPSRLSQSPCLSFLSHTANSHWLSIWHMVLQVSMLLSPYISPSLSSPPHPPPSPDSSIGLFSMSVCPLPKVLLLFQVWRSH